MVLASRPSTVLSLNELPMSTMAVGHGTVAGHGCLVVVVLSPPSLSDPFPGLRRPPWILRPLPFPLLPPRVKYSVSKVCCLDMGET